MKSLAFKRNLGKMEPARVAAGPRQRMDKPIQWTEPPHFLCEDAHANGIEGSTE